NARLAELARERDAVGAATASAAPPQLDVDTVMDYRRKTEKVFKQGDPAERKRLLRNFVQEVKLKPENLEVSISYCLPESVMNELVAGACFEAIHNALGAWLVRRWLLPKNGRRPVPPLRPVLP